MTQELWTAVDRYVVENLIPSDSVLDKALQANISAGLPTIDVAPNQGKLLHLLAQIKGAKRILEIGTLGGYSTIWLARALPPVGKLVTLEVDSKHAEVALANIDRAGLSSLVELRLGPAMESLSRLLDEKAPPFDFIFIDADKENIPRYFELSLRLSRPGTVIVTDNVIRDGAVIDPQDPDPRVQGVRRFFQMLATNTHIEATALQTVGSKGYDGFTLAVVKSVE
ncbi:MAG TPA: O-methyltransferase [Edaphobacter sp.]|nr:O-methyltransferase [Edaphobacter sp.]